MTENIVNENKTPISEQEQQINSAPEETDVALVENEETLPNEENSGDVEADAESDSSSKSTRISLIDGNIAENIILYGVPGCGKSHTVKESFCGDEAYIQRVVFHQDYTYSDFVGQLLPKTDTTTTPPSLSYLFISGPFTTILKKAVDDAEHMYFLVIEEINRGNAPAIFGDIFQLLDRDDRGESVYDITNFDIAQHIYNDKEHKVKIPGNLTLLATMNTADQNVFTLDTAFKRRWRMCSIKNNINQCKYKNDNICGTNVVWKDFVSGINNKIIENSENMFSNEDKRLGSYFVRPQDLKNTQLFAEKVLMYLWNDVFRYNRSEVFKTDKYKILEELIEGFYKVGFGVFKNSLGFDAADMRPIDTTGSSSTKVGIYNTSKANDIVNNIKTSNSSLYGIYETIYNGVKSQIPNLEIYCNYATDKIVCLKNAPIDHVHDNFAAVKFQPSVNRLQVYVETSPMLTSGPLAGTAQSTPSAPRKFTLNVDSSSNLPDVVDIIVASYTAEKI